MRNSTSRFVRLSPAHLICTCLALVCISVFAQWQPLGPGGGMITRACTVTPELLLVGTNAGIYRSTDNGASFQPHSVGFPSGKVNGLLHHDGVTYASVGISKGIYTSTDQGVTWTLSRPGRYFVLDNFQVVQGYVMARNNTGDSLYFTNNGGLTWTARHFNQNSSWRISAVGDKLFSQSTTLGPSPGLFRSDDLGLSWELCGPILPYISEVHDSGNSIYAFGRHVLESNDGGLSFQQVTTDTLSIPSPWGIFGPTHMTRSGNRFIGHHETVTDLPAAWWEPGNSGWTAYPAVTMPSSQTSTMFSHQGDVWVCHLNNAVYRLPSGGSAWSSSTTPGIHALPFSSLQLLGTEVFATKENEILKAVDASTTFTVDDPAGIPNSNPLRGVARVGPNLIAATAGFSSALQLYRSSDNGASWAQASLFNLSSTANVIVRNDTAFYYGALSGDARCYMADAQGALIGDLNAGLLGLNFDERVASMISHNGVLHAAITGNITPTSWIRRRALPSDTQWQIATQTLNGESFGTKALASFDGELYMGLLSGGGVRRSNDGGTSWTLFNTGLPDLSPNKFFHADGFLLMATDRGVFVHESGQAGWVDISNNLPVGDVLDVVMTNEHVWALLEGSGVWRIPRFGHVSVGVVDSQPLLRAWPNPCRDALSIQGAMAGKAELSIRDMLGRVVLTQLANASGGMITMDLSALPAGYYSCEVVEAGLRHVLRFAKE